MSDRVIWEQFLLNPSKPGRFFANASSGLGVHVTPIQDVVAIDLLSKLIGREDTVRELVDTIDFYFGGYIDFFGHQLKSLLRALTADAFHIEEVQGPSVRGNVNWQRTVQGRSSQRLLPFQFVVRRNARSNDTPENRLLKCLILTVVEDLDRLSAVIGTKSLPESLANMKHVAEGALKNEVFSTVQTVNDVTQIMRDRAISHRFKAYADSYRLLMRRRSMRNILENGRFEALSAFIGAGWFAPVSDDDLFELYVLFLLVDILEVELDLGKPVEFGLIKSGRAHVAKYKKQDLSVSVFFNQSPALLFGIGSEYRKVLRSWDGLMGAERRPDICVELHTPGRTDTRFIVEVKRSSDSAYRSDSVYKVFGYLYDFRKLWNPATAPHAILVFPDSVSGTSTKSARDLAVLSAQDREGIAECLTMIVSGHTAQQ
jgi:hypothetical protein